MSNTSTPPRTGTAPPAFSPYQRFATALLALLQFAVILDFMVMSPLGAMIMPDLAISTHQFGQVVSAYAFSAGLSGLLTAGFADRFDRKKLLLVFYAGFLGGTLWCGLAGSYTMLLCARIVTGLFGGVIGAMVLAIATDLFAPAQRGRVMGLIQTGFAASQVLGLPMALFLANRWQWHAPFLALAAFGLLGGLLMMWRLQPVDAHLSLPQEHSPWMHLFHTLAQPRHLRAFVTTGLLTVGGYMLMPFSSAFVVHNLGISLDRLPLVYLITGLSTLVVTPLVGRLSDSLGKLPVFFAGSATTVLMVQIYTRLDEVSLAGLVLINVLMFAGIFSRMIPWQALMSGLPPPVQRGAFSALNASTQQMAGGLASLVAGHLVHFGADGQLLQFPLVADVVAVSALISAGLVWWAQRDTGPVPRTAPAHGE